MCEMLTAKGSVLLFYISKSATVESQRKLFRSDLLPIRRQVFFLLLYLTQCRYKDCLIHLRCSTREQSFFFDCRVLASWLVNIKDSPVRGWIEGVDFTVQCTKLKGPVICFMLLVLHQPMKSYS